MESLKMLNGNKQVTVKNLPKLVILGNKWNDTALEWVYQQTGLHFKEVVGGMEAQPETSKQIVELFLTYNFKTQYHDNLSSRNTLYLKDDHHVGFNVEHICYECVKANHITVNGLSSGDRLSC